VIFCFFFALVTLAGFWAARWRRPKAGMGSLEEWGLAGRSFGTWVTWFLIGGDLYTAYTVIAVPALLYGSGAMGFFALPYAVITYPYMMMVLPRLWTVCHRHGYVTFADFVAGRYGNRWLTIAIALTGVLALMPYIALQMYGIQISIAALGIPLTVPIFGLNVDVPLLVAFIILAAYTYTSGLRAPAMIALVKDLMIFIVLFATIIYIPIKLGGFGPIFAAAHTKALATPKTFNDLLSGPQMSAYVTLALGSALALFLYPHSLTGVLSSNSAPKTDPTNVTMKSGRSNSQFSRSWNSRQ